MITPYETRFEMYCDEIPKGQVGAELGVCKSPNAMWMHQICKPSHFHLVDLWNQREPTRPHHPHPILWYGDHENLCRRIFEDEIEAGTVSIHRKMTTDWLKSIEDRSLDWIYIDSDHWYKSVKSEIELACQKVKVGGLVLGDDFDCQPVAWCTGVQRAVVEAINENFLEMVALSSEIQPSFCCKVLEK